MHEAPQAPSELSRERPKGSLKWKIILALICGILLWINNFKVDVVGGITGLMLIAPAFLFLLSPWSGRWPKIVQMTILILLLLFGIVFVEVWGEKKVRKWLNMPHWSEQYKTRE